MPFDGLDSEPFELKVLRSARQMIANGWVKNHLCAWDGKTWNYCLVGAYRYAHDFHRGGSLSMTHEVDGGASDAMFGPILRRNLPVGWQVAHYFSKDVKALFRYNDSLLRVQKHVIALYDRAIRELEDSLSPPQMPNRDHQPQQISFQTVRPNAVSLSPCVQD